jgi:hypothetical protein
VSAISYIADPKGWLLLAGGRISLAVGLADGSPLLPELWNLVSGETETDAVLDVLTRGGISSAPDFAIVQLGPAGKVLVRGAVTVVVNGDAMLTGTGFSSWAERSFDRVDGVIFDQRSNTRSVPLPLVGGVVRVGWFRADVTDVASFAPSKETTSHVKVASEPPARAAKSAGNDSRPEGAPTTPPSGSTPADATVAAPPEDAEDAEEPVVEPEGDHRSTAYDHLFGDTSYRTVEDAAVRTTDDEAGASAPGLEDRTVVATDLAALRAQRRARRGRTEQPPAAPVAAYFVELSTGGRELLDQPLVIGRAPTATALGGGVIPRLVTMTTPNQDLSRTHAQIAVEGGAVVVTDLHSRNGTMVTLPGRAAQKLREGEPTVVIPGTLVDLGDGATLTVREV